MLRMKDMEIRYKEDCIFEKVNMEVDKGEILVVTGHSGSGKSSLLKAINGILLETDEVEVKGAILYNNESILKKSISARSQFISTVFQNPKTQFYCINTTDELAFALENRNVPREKILETIQEYTTKLHTSYLLDRNIFTLSGGEKQLVAITGTVCMNNDIYLFDEPSASLDHEAIGLLKNILMELKAMGKIVIVAEHRLYYLSEIMDKLAILHEKKMNLFSAANLTICQLNAIGKQYGLRTFEEIKKQHLYQQPYHRIKLCEGMDYQETEALLCCDRFKVCYSKNPVVDISISFSAGINFIIGRNGIGKTTFIRRLSGLMKGKGNSFWEKQKISKNYKFISMVMQDVNYQLFTESVWQELSIASSDDATKERTLEELDLYDKREFHPQILSGGEKQRLLIGIAQVSDKPVVILDEPTSGLCKSKMIKMIDYLHEMEQQNKVVIVITHDYELIQQCGGNIFEFVR